MDFECLCRRVTALLLAGLLVACAASLTDASSGGTAGCDLSDRFAKAQCIFKANCVVCHVHDHSNFGSYSEADFTTNGVGGQMYVVAGNPSSSLLYTKLNGAGFGGDMPQGGKLSSDDLTAIESWIAHMSASSGGASNTAPSVNAGSDQTAVSTAGTTPISANLDATVSDDGLPSGGTLSYAWTCVSAGGGTCTGVSFGNAAAVDTSVSLPAAGPYTLRLTASDGALSASDDVIVTAIVNAAPAVNAGNDQSITLPASASISATVTDDGYPQPSSSTLTWTCVATCPGTVTFGNAHAAATTASFSTNGTYTLRMTASDGTLSATDDVLIAVGSANTPPAAPNAGSDQSILRLSSGNATTTLSGTATTDNVPGPFTTTWSCQSASGGASCSNVTNIASASSLSTSVTFNAAGVYIMRLTASDGALTSNDDVQVTVVNNLAPATSISVSSAMIQQPDTLNLDGTVTDSDGPNAASGAWTKVSGPGTVTFGNAALIDTTATFSATGSYVLRLTGSDGDKTSTANISVNVVDTSISLSKASRFSSVRTVMLANCATGCHSHSFNSPDDSSVFSSESSFVSAGLVSAGDSNGSYLWTKLQNSDATSGDKNMPNGAAPLSAGDLATIKNWILYYGQGNP